MTYRPSINVDVMHWPTLGEVYNYATTRAIPLDKAVEELVHQGLRYAHDHADDEA